MVCLGCSYRNASDARFCAGCGAGLSPQCEACRALLDAETNFCPACGYARQRSAHSEPEEEGERRYATVMFSDLTGYTALNETTDPEIVEALMLRIRRIATEVIERHGGTVNQFVGDEVMALFGVPTSHSNDPRQAVHAARELHGAVEALIDRDVTVRGHSLCLHSGISSGLMVVRRSDSRAGHFAVTGDTVNSAARLRSAAAPGEIIVDQETWRHIAEFFVANARPLIQLKGKKLPVSTYRVRGERRAEQGIKPLVGRAQECAVFQSMLTDCRHEKRGRAIVLIGEPGIGKSRLAAEFVAKATHAGFLCCTSAVVNAGIEPGRSALQYVVRHLLELTDEPGTHAESLAELFTHLDSNSAIFIYDLIGMPPPTAARALLSAMTADARADGASRALASVVQIACTERPQCVVVEDLHWADASTRRQVSTLIEQSARCQLLLILTTRPVETQAAGAWQDCLAGSAVTPFLIEPLTRQQAIELTTQTTTMPEAFRLRCVERAAGNPLFLEHLLLNTTDTEEAQLPGSIQALVQARVDRLARHDKQALQAAAVFGAEIDLDALAYLLERHLTDCPALVDQALLRQVGDQYLFTHALIREGAYASLLHTRRRQLHARAGEWLESRNVALAAEHFERADDARSAACYLAASNESVAALRYPQALALTKRGLALQSDLKTRLRLLMRCAELQVELGDPNGAIETSQAALAIAEDPRERAAALIETAGAMRLLDRLDEGLAALASAQPLADAAASPEMLSRLHHLRGNLLFPRGLAAACLYEHSLALQWAERAASIEAQANALGGLGDAHFLGGRMRSAHVQFSRSVDLAREHGFGRLEVAVLQIVGWTAHFLNDSRAAVALGHESIALATRVFHPRAEVISRGMVAWVDGVVRGNHQRGIEHIEVALPIAATIGAKRFEAQLHMTHAMLNWQRGNHGAAMTQAQLALDICQQHGMGYVGPFVHGVIALIATKRAERENALIAGEAALERGAVSHNHLYYRALAIETCLDLGDWDAALSHCARLETYTAAEPLPWSDFVIERGRALARVGQGERSAQLHGQLTTLREEAVRAEFNLARPALDRALNVVAGA